MDLTWRDVADGLCAAARLEAELEERWSLAVRRAREQRVERRLAAACAGSTGLAVAVAVVLAMASQQAYAVIGAILVGVSCSASLLAGLRRRMSPAPAHGDDPSARRSGRVAGAVLRAWPRLGRPVALDIVGPWWAQIAHVRGPRHNDDRPFQEHGDVGESSFVADLSLRLNHEHVAIRNVLVTRGLDADVVVVGPSGIWVFEVKHWSGTIECRDGRWWRTRSYYAPGGIAKFERTPFKWAPDEQWIKERRAVQETIRRRLPQARELGEEIGGGIVFSHQGANWDRIAERSRSGYGSPAFWASTVSDAPHCPLTQAMMLRVIDALLEWHRRLAGDGDAGRCAVQLAQGLFSQVSAKAQDYCGGEAA